MNKNIKFFLLISLIYFAGCAGGPKPLYSWGDYEDQVYSYFTGGPIEKQILELEKHAEKTKAAGLALPPGFQAHLGLLYSKVGRDDKFAQQLDIEKSNFPEVIPFFENIASKFKKR